MGRLRKGWEGARERREGGDRRNGGMERGRDENEGGWTSSGQFRIVLRRVRFRQGQRKHGNAESVEGWDIPRKFF